MLRGASLPVRAAITGAAVAVSTGAGLVAYLVTGLSLPLGVTGALAVTGTAGALVWRRLTPAQRQIARSRAWIGVRAGLAATAAYDLTRLFVVEAFALQISPFAALPLFGQLLTSAPASSAGAQILGVGYHLANGVGFAVAYALSAPVRGILAGITWALVLEAAMLTFYPGWLDVRAIGELFGMSITGHLAYGATLGWLDRRLADGADGERAP